MFNNGCWFSLITHLWSPKSLKVKKKNKRKSETVQRKSSLSSAFCPTPNNSYSCRCPKLSHVVPPFIIFERGCKRRWFAPEIVLEFKCALQLCPRSVSCIVFLHQPSIKPCVCFEEASLCILLRQAHKHSFGNDPHVTIIQSYLCSHQNFDVMLLTWKTKQVVSKMGLRSWLNGGSHMATMS